MSRKALALWLFGALVHAVLQSTASEIPEKHEKIFPKKVVGDGSFDDRLSTEINPGAGDGLHERECSFQLEFEGKTFVINLELNVGILGEKLEAEDASNGQIASISRRQMDFTQYQGAAYILGERNETWDAWFDVKDVMNGAIILPDPVIVTSTENGHIAYRDSAVESRETASCGLDLLTDLPRINISVEIPPDGEGDGESGSRKKRNIRDQTKYIQTIFMLTEDLYQDFGQNVEAIVQGILTLSNGMDCLYKPLGIRVVIHLIVYFSAGNPFTVDLNDRSGTLDAAEAYIKNRRYLDADGSSWKTYDHVVLLNGHPYVTTPGPDGTVLGVARLSTMCSAHSLSYTAYHQLDTFRLILVATHEVGHSFGLIHNENYGQACSCGESACIMNAFVSQPSATKWTDCSMNSIDSEIQYSSGHCLLDVPSAALLETISACGNKYLEAGEECDCGTASECESACCNPLTCQLHDFAECDGSQSCCDAATCQFAPSGTVCRELCDDECDLPEYCNGTSATCPDNRVAEDGTLCNSNLDRCKGGYCLTRTRQCKLILGGGDGIADKSETCYFANIRGDQFGNCGVDAAGGYRACGIPDLFCGKLFCAGTESSFRPASREAQRGQLHFTSIGLFCYVYIESPLPGVFDYSYVQDGSACSGNAGVCSQGTCVVSASACSPACGGTCNDAGNCFCADGLAPPDCTLPGNGGSIDSGPPPSSDADCSSYSKATDAETLRSELQMELVCGQKLEISFNLCPFIANDYTVEDLVVIGANQEYDPLNQTVSVPDECVAKAEPFSSHPWRAKIVFDPEVCSGELPTIDATHVIRSARFRAIRGGSADGTSTIVRKNAEFFFDFQCKQEKSLYAQVAAKPQKLAFLGYEDATRRYDVSRSFFRDSSYMQPIDIDNDVINVGDRVHVLLELQESDPSLVLQTLACWISDSSDKTKSPVYHIIEDRCPATDALGESGANLLNQNCVSVQTKFSFLAFEYLQRSQAEQLLYLHCRLQTCHSELYDCSCPTCTGSRKKRSNRNVETGRIATMGPLKFGK